MLKQLLSLIPNLIGIASTTIEGWQARKTKRLETELRIEEAKATAYERRAEKDQDAVIQWDQSHADASSKSWKDEYWTIVLSIPAIMCFIPGLAKYVKVGFEALSATPDWYVASFGLMVAASVGYHKLMDYFERKGKKE